MFRKSPYLDALPVISVDLSRVSAYRLREAHADGQYCTAEVAIALLDLAGIPLRLAPWATISPVSGSAIWREKPFIRAASQQPRQKAFKIIRSLAFTGGLHEPTRVGSATAS
jgi:hypothetical protein